MRVQLLPPLVEAVDRQEECFGVRDMDRNRHFQSASGLPHWVEPRIIDANELSGTGLA